MAAPDRMSVIMNPDDFAAGVFKFSSEADDDAPAEAAGEDAPPR